MSEIFNPWSLPRPELREDEREYTDPRQPGIKVPIRFRELNPFLEGQAFRLYGEYYEKFVRPKPQNGKDPSPQLLPAPTPVLLNEIILDDIVMLQAMHVPQEGQPKYGVVEWSGFAVNMPDAYREMVRVCKGLNRGPEQDSGNARTPENGSSGESSNQPSSTGSNTQNGSSTQPDALAASPERSEESLDASKLRMGAVGPIPEPSTPGSSPTMNG